MFIDKNGEVRKPYAYLAGWEMFWPDGKERGAKWKETAAKYGIIGYFPPDEAPLDQYPEYEPKDDSTAEKLMKGFIHDVNHMRRSDMIIAQLEDWRGAEPDSGTCFECGYAAATGMRLYAWCSNPTTLIERTCAEKTADENGVLRDSEGYAFEDRGFPLDSSFATMKIASSFEEACKMARADFDAELIAAGFEPWTGESEE